MLTLILYVEHSPEDTSYVFALENPVAMARSLKQLSSSHGRQFLKHW